MSLEENCSRVLWVKWGCLMGVNGQLVARARSRVESSRQRRQSRQVKGVRASLFLSSFSRAVDAGPRGHGAGTRAIHPARARRGAPATPRPAWEDARRRSAPHRPWAGGGTTRARGDDSGALRVRSATCWMRAGSMASAGVVIGRTVVRPHPDIGLRPHMAVCTDTAVRQTAAGPCPFLNGRSPPSGRAALREKAGGGRNRTAHRRGPRRGRPARAPWATVHGPRA